MEMLCEKFPIVSAHPLSLAQTLISVEGQLLLLYVKLLRLLSEHKLKSFILVAEELVGATNKLFKRALGILPLLRIFQFEKVFLFEHELTLFFHVLAVQLVSGFVNFPQAFNLQDMVL
jgi:hypothetical protein